MSNIRQTPEEIKTALLKAAKSLFLTNGIAATEMKTIAATAALSRSTLYRYMIDKNQLAFIISSDVLMELTSKSEHFTTGEARNGYEKLCGFTHHFAATLCENLPLVNFLSEFDSIFRGEYPHIPEAEEYQVTINRMLHRTAQYLFEGLADGSIRHMDDPLFFVSVLIITLLGLAERMLPRSEHYLAEHQASTEKVLFASADIMLTHIKA